MVTFIKCFKSELQIEAFEIQNMNHLSYLLLLNKEREMTMVQLRGFHSLTLKLVQLTGYSRAGNYTPPPLPSPHHILYTN